LNPDAANNWGAGKKIRAGASITAREAALSFVFNAPSPAGKASVNQHQIARWPPLGAL
jgi:hypothetical protein